jgi:hypothetical protein
MYFCKVFKAELVISGAFRNARTQMLKTALHMHIPGQNGNLGDVWD